MYELVDDMTLKRGSAARGREGKDGSDVGQEGVTGEGSRLRREVDSRAARGSLMWMSWWVALERFDCKMSEFLGFQGLENLILIGLISKG